MRQEEKSLLSRNKILEASGALFAEKGFDATTMQDIMARSGLSKGAIYHHFKSKEEIMQVLGDKMFFANNPFDEIRKRTELDGLQKIRELLKLNQSDTKRNDFNMAAIPILKDTRILATAVEANRRVLTPLWLELLEEGKADGSIKTNYVKEISELLPLINFWFMPSIFPATAEEIHNKFIFVIEALSRMGLPLMKGDDMKVMAEKFIKDISLK
ncbi:TetR/AcrR family transcriptional regulator [bacterium 1XD42-94]|jgi:AcrR family transcriptional regulator|nr:TetR/AcrR family transcriptional regulator [bacterium 1XD42-76]NBK05320.1 TetR/AcrR family transcriptional regulator [bacterium 1XD42-94]